MAEDSIITNLTYYIYLKFKFLYKASDYRMSLFFKILKTLGEIATYLKVKKQRSDGQASDFYVTMLGRSKYFHFYIVKEL